MLEFASWPTVIIYVVSWTAWILWMTNLRFLGMGLWVAGAIPSR